MSAAASFEELTLQAVLQHRTGSADTIKHAIELFHSLGPTTPLGHAIKPLFSIGANNRSVNFGSYGCPPLPVACRRFFHMTETIDADTDVFMRATGEPQLREVRTMLARFLGLRGDTDGDQVILVDNAADAFNVVAASLIVSPQFAAARGLQSATRCKKVLLMDRVYPMVRKTIEYHNNRAMCVAEGIVKVGGAASLTAAKALAGVVDVVDFVVRNEHVQSDEALIRDVVERCVSERPDFIVVDHVAWSPSWILPVAEIARAVKAAMGGDDKIVVIVDAAHSIGNADVDFSAPAFQGQEERSNSSSSCSTATERMAFDVFFSNCHKWLTAPKHSAVLIVRPELRRFLHPVCISNFYRGDVSADSSPEAHSTTAGGPEDRFPHNDVNALQHEFFWRGTRDFSNFLVLKDVIEFRAKLGEDRIRQYNRDTAFEGAKRAAAIWGSKLLLEDRTRLGSIVCAEFPERVLRNPALVERCLGRALAERGTFVPLMVFDGKCYARFSCQMYNAVEDYEFVAKTFLELLSEEEKITIHRPSTAH